MRVSLVSTVFHLLTCGIPSLAMAQTSIVSIMTPDSIVIGADSKSVTKDYKEAALVCKVGSAEGMFWARSGIASDTMSGFSVDSIARDAASKGGTIQERVDRFEQLLIPPLKNFLKQQKETDPAWFNAHAEGKTIIGILFARFEDSEPRMLSRSFKPHSGDRDMEIETVRKGCPGDCKTPLTWAAYLGYQKTVKAETAKDPLIWVKKGTVDGVRYLVQKQMDACPKFVGPPIVVLKIERKGPTWISGGPCPRVYGTKEILPTRPNISVECDEADEE